MVLPSGEIAALLALGMGSLVGDAARRPEP